MPPRTTARVKRPAAPQHDRSADLRVGTWRSTSGGPVTLAAALTPAGIDQSPMHLRAAAIELGIPMAEYANTLSMAIRLLDGGVNEFLKGVHLASTAGIDEAIKFLATYNTWEPKFGPATPDAICARGGIPPVDLIKAIVGVLYTANAELANWLAAAAHPGIVARTVQSAERLNSRIGRQDRRDLLTHAGFLPTSKGAIINVNATAQAAAQAIAAPGTRAAGDRSPLPSFLSAINDVAAAREQIQRQLLTEGGVDDAEDPFAGMPVIDAEIA